VPSLTVRTLVPSLTVRTLVPNLAFGCPEKHTFWGPAVHSHSVSQG